MKVFNMINAIYIRTSTNMQSSGAESQLLKISKYCELNEIKDVKIFQDIGLSGKTQSRPALDELVEAIKKKEVASVIVYKLDRLGRSTIHLLELTKLMQSHDVSLISVTQNIDTSTAMGKFFLTILSAISELERETISERVKSGMENAKSKGKRIGRKKLRNSSLIRYLHNQGKSYREIAELADCSLGSVQAEIKNLLFH